MSADPACPSPSVSLTTPPSSSLLFLLLSPPLPCPLACAVGVPVVLPERDRATVRVPGSGPGQPVVPCALGGALDGACPTRIGPHVGCTLWCRPSTGAWYRSPCVLAHTDPSVPHDPPPFTHNVSSWQVPASQQFYLGAYNRMLRQPVNSSVTSGMYRLRHTATRMRAVHTVRNSS